MEPSTLPNLEIEHVYGYRAFECRNNLHYNAEGNAVFMSAACGVIFNTETKKQTVYGGTQVEMKQKSDPDSDQLCCHRNDILCLDISKDRTKAVTGQEGKYPSVHVWDAITGKKIKAFQLDKDSRGVMGASISPCGRYVGVVDDHDKHRVFIYNLERECKVLELESGASEMKNLAWSKRPDDLRLAIQGEKQIQFWCPADVTKKLKNVGIFDKAASTQLHCVQFDEEGWCYTGGDNGQIQVWGTDNKVVRCVKAHAAAVTCVKASGNKLITGGKDHKISIIQIMKDATFKLESQFDLQSLNLQTHLPKSFPISVDLLNGNIIAGLRNGMIFEKRQKEDPRLIASSHYNGEAWALCVVDNDHVITACDDNLIIMYDINTMRPVRGGVISSKDPKAGKEYEKIDAAKLKRKGHTNYPSTSSPLNYNKQSRAIVASKKLNHLVIANNAGKISVRSLDDFEKKLQTIKDPKYYCEVMKYSPCEKFLAIGSHDMTTYIYEIDAEGKYALYCTFKKHSSYVSAIDWAADSQSIRTHAGDHATLYFDIQSKEFDPHGHETEKDKIWASSTMKHGDDRKGITPPGEDLTHVNGVVCSKDNSVMFTSDDFGLVNAFHYPNPQISDSRSFCGHSEHVASLAITPDQKRMFTLGGEDKSLIQWKISGLSGQQE